MFNVPQADCDAYASQLQSTGWIYSSPLSGKQIFNASNVAPGDNATKGMSIIIEYNDGQMRVGFSKVNERRKPWITYL